MRRLLALALVAGLAGCGAPRDLGLDGIFAPPEKPKDGSLMDTKPNPPVAPMTTTVKKAEAPAPVAKKTDKEAKKPAVAPAKPKTEEELKKEEAKRIAP